MSTTEKVDNKQLETLINSAIKKIQGRKENDICRYLPVKQVVISTILQCVK